MAMSTENADQVSRSLLKFREPGFPRSNRSSVVGIHPRNSLPTGADAADGHNDQTHAGGNGEDSHEEDRKTPEEHGSIGLPCLPDRHVPPVPLHRYNADNQEGPGADRTQER